MSYPDIQPAEKSDVTATLHFLSRNKLYEVEKPYNHHYNLPDSVDIPRSNIFSEAVDNILIRNIRHCDLNFVNNGIEFVNLQSRMTYDDFWDPTKIEAIFVPEIEELVQSKLGAQEVHVYEYACRRRHETFPVATGEKYKNPQPVLGAHIDYTLADVCDAIHRAYGVEKGDDMMSGRFSLINVWKPLDGPVLDYPLAVCDASSVDAKSDLVPADSIFPTFVTEIYYVQHNPGQRWYYVKEQMDHELLIFRGQDSKSDASSGVPHCAFAIPGTAPDVQLRESIEVRAFVFY